MYIFTYICISSYMYVDMYDVCIADGMLKS